MPTRGYSRGGEGVVTYASYKALAQANAAPHLWPFESGSELTDVGTTGGLDFTASGAAWEAPTIPGALGQYVFTGGDYDRLESADTDLGTDRTYRMELIAELPDYSPTTVQAICHFGDASASPYLWAGSDSFPLALGRCLRAFTGSGVYPPVQLDRAALVYISLGYDHASAHRHLVIHQHGWIGPAYYSDRQASGTPATGKLRVGGSNPSPGTWYGRHMRIGGVAFYPGSAYPSENYLASVKALLAT